MRPRRNHSTLKRLGTNAFMLLGVSSIAALAYVVAGPTHLGLIVRFACATAAGFVFLQIIRHLRAMTGAEPTSEFDAALRPPSTSPTLSPQFLKLREELKHSIRQRGYFDRLLWPRLFHLAERRGIALSPPGRSWIPRRGPSLRTLSELVGQLEDHGT